MTRQISKMPTVGGVAAGQTAVIDCPLGYTYERFYIRMNAGAVPADVAEADWGNNISEIRVKVDGDTKIQVSAADLVTLNNFFGHTHDAGVLPIFLSRPWMRTASGEDISSYGTASGINNLVIEVDLVAGITINSFEVRAVQSEARDWGSHYRLVKMSKTVSAVGDIEIASLPRGPFVMTAVHLKSADITTAQVFRNDKKFYDTDKAVRDQHMKIIGRKPQAGFTHVDFLGENRIFESVEMDALDFRLKLNFTAAPGSMPIYIESVQSPFAISY